MKYQIQITQIESVYENPVKIYFINHLLFVIESSSILFPLHNLYASLKIVLTSFVYYMRKRHASI